ncbi:MAG: phosphate regulon sensor histidine kinase PhoR [Pseudomonadota bacterium]|nr:phosphate regulon sensor histidine kinase PhoR [Pseudomonadota bacterium]
MLRRLLLVAVPSLLLALMAGLTAGLCLLVALITVLLALHLRNLWRLTYWLRQPKPETVPEARGPWGDAFVALFRLQRKAEHGAELLREALNRFQDAGAALPDGVVIMDSDDRIEWCNPLAEEHLGIELPRDRGQQLTYLLRQPHFVDWVTGESYERPLTLRNARNEGRTLMFRMVRYGSREKLVVSRDITLLDRAERVRRDFVANVSHELRTPITVISGFLETLEDSASGADGEALDEQSVKRAISLMRSQAARMQQLVEELLTLSRLESDAAPAPAEKFQVRALIELLGRETETLSAGRHRVMVRIEDDTTLLGSRSELHSAFGNLASNAVRYTPEGGEVELIWREVDGQGVFTVRDSGIGIAPEHIPRLTERFYRVDKSRSRETGGTGLGLAIVQHVLTRHQGRLEIESTPGRGSRFSAILPPERLKLSGRGDGEG